MLLAIPNHNAASCRCARVFYTMCSLLLALCATAWAAQPDRIAATIENHQTVVLKGSVDPRAKAQFDQGPVDASMELGYITLQVSPSPSQQAALNQLLAEQQDPSSPNYHKWLTPGQFGQRFGLSNADIARITQWLRSQGFRIIQVARGRDWIAFGGTVAQVQRTFRTELHRYNVDGEEHFANSMEPSIPKALEGVVAGFRGLKNFRLEPMNVKKSDAVKISPYYFSGGNYLAPGDIATIYDIGPLYTAGINGAGTSIAIIGQTDIYAADIAQFRSGFGLSANVPKQILASGCTHPGVTGDLAEADIDLEWSGAVARNATIFFVLCDPNHGGVGTSAQYAIDNDVAPVVSMSYGGCESLNGQSNALAFQRLVQKANAEGITFLASTGDSGAAGCDSSGNSNATQGLAVNIPASIPEVTAVGGTEFNEGSGTYWGSTNGSNGGSALSYIPELAWDDNSTGTGFAPHLASTGGGTSIYFPKPSWQTGTGVPNNNFRNLPDVAMSASADHDGYIVCTNNGCAGGIQGAVIYGGTSVATPVFAGIVTLLNQQMKNTPPAGLGNINTTLYQFAQSVPAAFHDVPAGNYNNGGAANPSGNTVPCTQGTTSCPAKAPFQFGFRTGTGYDQVTGLGSVDAHVFVTNWASAAKIPTTTTVTLSPVSVNVGATGPVMAKATVTHATGTGTPTGSVSFYVDGSTTAAGSGTLSGGSFTFSYNPTALAAGNHTITATYGGDSTFAGSTSARAVLGVQDFRIAASPMTVTVTAPGQSGMTTLTITPLGGFSQTLTYSCSPTLPSEATCTFAAASATSETLTIATTAPSAKLDKGPFGRRSGIFYALLFPSFLGFVLMAGTKKRPPRGVRLLGLIAVLALSTLWMPACGGGSSPLSNPGTPAGTSTVTVTATTGGTSPLTHPVTITLTVQ
jgi:subtilase family serine protease